MNSSTAQASAPSMLAFRCFMVAYTGAFALGIAGLVYLVVSSWAAS